MSTPVAPPPSGESIAPQPPEPNTGPPSVPGQGFGPAPDAEQGLGPAPAPPKKTAGRKVLGVLAAILVALVIGGIKFGVVNAIFGESLPKIDVGDCMIDAKADDMKAVDCADAAAAYKVVGKIENKTEAEFGQASDANPCTAYPTAESAFWAGERKSNKSGKGFILCLAPNAR